MTSAIAKRGSLQVSWLDSGAPVGPAPTGRAAEVQRLLAAASEVVERALSECSDDYLVEVQQRGGE